MTEPEMQKEGAGGGCCLPLQENIEKNGFKWWFLHHWFTANCWKGEFKYSILKHKCEENFRNKSKMCPILKLLCLQNELRAKHI